ncbi:MAG TPA: SAM-dependent methyltransferase, partial [bacterium]|nr:SAM-dependent methyltransferase [bacterium]
MQYHERNRGYSKCFSEIVSSKKALHVFTHLLEYERQVLFARHVMLYLVATPIGAADDLTLRAKRILAEADFIVCEEYRAGKRLLDRLAVDHDREILLLNEHSDQRAVREIVTKLKAGKHGALISDAGTPLLADPGRELVNQCIACGIPVTPIPGPASPLAALVVAMAAGGSSAQGVDTAERDAANRRCLRCHGQEKIGTLGPGERRSMVGTLLDPNDPSQAFPEKPGDTTLLKG